MKQAISIYFLFIFVFTTNAQSQINNLHGKITDSNEVILPGASVIIVGTKYGVNANGAAVALFDMQQIDVLKGPQGTLFGRGAAIYFSRRRTNS